MADVKISALPAATTPLAGTEVLPIVQSATTDQVSVANLTAGRSVSAASLTLTTTPLAVGSGGTGTSTAFTAGSVVFAGTSGVYSQNNSQLFWNNSLNRLGIGTGSPGATLDIQQSSSTQLKISRTGNNAVFTLFMGSTDTYLSATNTSAALILATQDVEKMRIASDGSVGIGTTSPSATLHVKGGSTNNLKIDNGGQQYTELDFANNGTIKAYYYWDNTNSNFVCQTAVSASLTFGTNGSPRATIDASGNFLVGTTNTSESSGAGLKVLNTGGTVASVSGASTSSQSNWEMYSTGASAFRFYVGWNGTINATSTTISAISDRRFKENIVDLDVGLNALLSLKPRKFDWKDGKGKDIKGDRGWIADEFQQVFPDLIDTWKDEPPEGEEPYKSVRPDLMPVVVKAIQELAAKVQALEAKVA